MKEWAGPDVNQLAGWTQMLDEWLGAAFAEGFRAGAIECERLAREERCPIDKWLDSAVADAAYENSEVRQAFIRDDIYPK